MGSRVLLFVLLVLSTILVASSTARNVPDVFGDESVKGRLMMYWPDDYPARYYLDDGLGAIELIPPTSGAGDLYRYEDSTIEVYGDLVTKGDERTLYMKQWTPVEMSVETNSGMIESPNPSASVADLGAGFHAAQTWHPLTGTQHLLLILIRFNDPSIPPEHDPPYFQHIISGTGSIDAYFKEDSYDMITVTGTSTSWYTLDKSASDYDIFTWLGCRAGGGERGIVQFARDAIAVVVAAQNVHLNEYNHLMIVGTRNSAGDGVWGCRLGPGAIDIDTPYGRVRNLSIVSERSGLGTYIHEFSHDLCAGSTCVPDLYDYSCAITPPSSTCDPYEFIAGWDPMGPSVGQHHSAWPKMVLGWIGGERTAEFDLVSTPQTRTLFIDRIEDFVRSTAPDHYHVLRIGIDPSHAHRYFLVETRQKMGLDSGWTDSTGGVLQGLSWMSPNEGVLITYVDDELETGGGIVHLDDSGNCPNSNVMCPPLSSDQNPTTKGRYDPDTLWGVGQTYVNSNWGFAVAIQEWTGDGFKVTVTAPHVLYAVSFRALKNDGTNLCLGGGAAPTVAYTVTYPDRSGGLTLTVPFTVWVENGRTISFTYQDRLPGCNVEYAYEDFSIYGPVSGGWIHAPGGGSYTPTTPSSPPTKNDPTVITGYYREASRVTPNRTEATLLTGFTISVDPSELSLGPSASATCTISVHSVGTFSSLVTLSASGAPSGLNLVFNPWSVTPTLEGTADSVLTVTVAGAAVGDYPITIVGNSGGITHDATLTVHIAGARGGCLIATATYGSELSPEVQFLRSFRDNSILKTSTGSSFMIAFNAWYYSFSPYVAEFIRENSFARAVTRLMLYPLMGILRVGAFVFYALPGNLEVGAVVSGLLVSSLIGIVYVSPPLAAVFACSRRVRRIAKRIELPMVAAMLSALAGVAFVAAVNAPSVFMMLSTAAVVLATLAASALYTSRALLHILKRAHISGNA